jgi:hypothetical protein
MRAVFYLEDQRGAEFILILILILILSSPPRTRMRMIPRMENKNAFDSGKTGMKAFDESRRKQIGGLAPSFSLRRSAPKRSRLTSAVQPVS